MALGELIAVLEAQAAAKAAALRAGCKVALAAEAEAAERAAAQARQRALTELELQHAAEVGPRLATAQWRARETLLRAREAFLARLFAALQDRLRQSDVAARYRPLVPQQLALALRYAPQAPLQLRCRPELVEACTGAVAAAAAPCTIAVTPDVEVGIGFQLASDDDTLVIDRTLKSVLEQRRAEAALAVMARLEGPQP